LILATSAAIVDCGATIGCIFAHVAVGLPNLGPMAAGLGQAAAAAAAGGGPLMPGIGPLAGVPSPLPGPLGLPSGSLPPLGAMNLQQQILPGPLPGLGGLGGLGQMPPGMRPPGMGEQEAVGKDDMSHQ
jgi:hypothetical protein